MRCERYWRDGILLVEQGRPDPHRESCLDCRREHEARGELVRAIALVGAPGGDARWQARVWKQIDRAAVRRRPWFAWGGGLAAAACALVVFVSLRGRGEEPPPGDRPPFEIVQSEIVRLSTSASIGDLVRIRVRGDQEARIYRAEKLLLRCTATAATTGCSRDGGGLRLEHTFTLAGDYQLLIIAAGIAEPAAAGGPAPMLDRDLAAVMEGGGTPELHELTVR